ncbi:tail fiber protein [Salmonella phage STG2]|uniref:Tail fiber protein n=1 Tax=Salmonella phage STG2 TaxID=2480623 RepID=A0A3G2KAI5_9CAUD|nr:tail fiber protein [Salmonella phage STG2]AYN55984.1 tail fiber protein [Salmonella phage STG2]
MSRNLMPKSGAMAPYIVVNRDAAVAGVFSVDGESGAVVLTSKYLQISKYTTDKAATDSAIKSINESIGNINTALGGINTSIETKAAKGANNDITELNALTKAITIAQGGTGATDVAGSRKNLGLTAFEMTAVDTRMFSPDRKKILRISDAMWGAYNLETGQEIALGIGSGGTGALNPKDARKNLNIPVGANAEIIPANSNVLDYIAIAGQSGYYSSGDLVTHIPPVKEGWWTYNFHCHGVDINGAAQYGVLKAVGLSGSSWINVLDGTGNWKGWQEQFNLQSTVLVTNGGTGANTAAGAITKLGIPNIAEWTPANGVVRWTVNTPSEPTSTGTILKGGLLESSHNIAGVQRVITSLVPEYKWGESDTVTNLNVALSDAQGHIIRYGGYKFSSSGVASFGTLRALSFDGIILDRGGDPTFSNRIVLETVKGAEGATLAGSMANFVDGTSRVVVNALSVSNNRKTVLYPSGGVICKPGLLGDPQLYSYSIDYSGGAAQLWIDSSNFGNIQTAPVSDKLLKKDITYRTDNEVALKQVMQWKIADFRYKKRGMLPESEMKTGWIANDLVTISPECVKGVGLTKGFDENNPKGAYELDTVAIMAKMSQAIQAQQKEIEELKELVNQLLTK